MSVVQNQPSQVQYTVSQDILGGAGSGGGVIGDFNKSHKDYVHAGMTPKDRSDNSRYGKFTRSISDGIEAGALGGGWVGGVSMMIPDFILGKGTQDQAKYDLESEGLVGLVAHGAVDTVSTIARVPGGVTGGVVGLVTEPLTGSPAERMADAGAAATSSTTSALLSIPVGVALGAARLPSVIVKSVTTAVGGIIGGVFGFLGGVGRALFDI